MGILIKAPARRREPPVAPWPTLRDSRAIARDALHIREVVRITGLRREQLYMWQRRYGFPAPLRDAFGDRVYPPDQVARLKLIKQLLSEGWRAGAVVPLADSALQSMLGPHGRGAGAAAGGNRDRRQAARAASRSASCRIICRSCWSGQGLRKFLETDADSAQRSRARARRARRDAELPGAALRRSRAAAAARRDAARPSDARRAAGPARDAAQRSQSARPGDPRTAAVHRRRQLPDARRGRAGAGNRGRGERVQGRRSSCCCSIAASRARSRARKSAACAPRCRRNCRWSSADAR